MDFHGIIVNMQALAEDPLLFERLAGHRPDCPLLGPNASLPGNCNWCGMPLPNGGRRRRWCCEGHGRLFWMNHAWPVARDAALRRDGYTCIRCHRRDGTVLSEACSCGRSWPCAQVDPRWGATWEHHVVQSRLSLEVNHRDPLVGRGYRAGCAHHVDGLETLCVPCHQDVTQAQARGRRQEAREAAEAARAAVMRLPWAAEG